jgi:hypothetical protein
MRIQPPVNQVLSFLALSIVGSSAYGGGFVRLDSQGYLRSSTDRGNASATLALGPDFSTEGEIFSTRLHATAIGFVQDTSSFTVEAMDAYISTSSRLSSLHQISLGRRNYDWSAADDEWKIGLWTPRFNWDPLRPQQVGLTGAFYHYQSADWRLVAYASPIAVPERGFPIRNDMTSASPDWVPPFQQLPMLNQYIPARYNIIYPSITDLILRPNASVSLRYGGQRGAWTSASVGFMPVHQVLLSVDPGVNPQTSALDVDVHPSVAMHRLITGEAGYRGREWNLWASATREVPLAPFTADTWISNPIGPSVIAAAGAQYSPYDWLKLRGSYLWIDEDAPPVPGDLAVGLPPRYMYMQAMRLAGEWTANSALTYGMQWTYDVAQSSNLLSLDVTYAKPTQSWMVGLGSDIFTSTTRQGQIGQYLGNDRLRARVSYVF